MKALIDTNILMDFVDNRDDFVDAAAMVFTICSKGMVDGYVSAHSLMDICYLLRKKKTPQERIEILQDICDIFSVVETTDDVILTAAKRMDFSDFEDSVVNQVALRTGVDYIITRNRNDFTMADIPVVSPIEFIELFEDTTKKRM